MNLWIRGRIADDSKEDMVNTLTFRTKGGTLLTIDREQTAVSFENHQYNAVWHNIYVVSVNGTHLDSEEESEQRFPKEKLKKLLHGSSIVGINYDDEAELTYKVKLQSVTPC